ncbi:DUF5675 family protein [Sphingobacterium sp. BS-2]|uniref:DUF5675 family protein n=1 Tax=Sphingobacterium sp. BS-2 TaxID=3377129 RepID=UPI0038FC304F
MIELVRVHSAENSTVSHLYIDGLFACYLLEDKIRSKKIFAKTCIHEGIYPLSLNTTAGMNSQYSPKFGRRHKGMLEIQKIPEFSLVFFHIGNYHTDTKGCPLMGSYFRKEGDDFMVLQSALAYKTWYPVLVEKIKMGTGRIKVVNRLQEFNYD